MASEAVFIESDLGLLAKDIIKQEICPSGIGGQNNGCDDSWWCNNQVGH